MHILFVFELNEIIKYMETNSILAVWLIYGTFYTFTQNWLVYHFL